MHSVPNGLLINFTHFFFLEEERKRKNENAFNAVSFTYGDTSEPKSAGDTEPVMDSNLSLPEHPPTSSVDTGEDDKFIPPPGLCLPEGLQTVSF